MESVKEFDYDDGIPSVQTSSGNTPIKISEEHAEIEVSEFPVTDKLVTNFCLENPVSYDNSSSNIFLSRSFALFLENFLKIVLLTGVVLQKSALKDFAKFLGKRLCESLFFDKVTGLCDFIKKETMAQKRVSGTGVFLRVLRNF